MTSGRALTAILMSSVVLRLQGHLVKHVSGCPASRSRTLPVVNGKEIPTDRVFFKSEG